MIEIKIYRRHDILSDIIKIVSHANENEIPISKDEFSHFLRIYIMLYPPLYTGIEFLVAGSFVVVSKVHPGEKNDIICELKFPTK